jgi:hypothetical protein
MNFKETGAMLAVLTTAYTARLLPNIDEVAIKTWQSLLADIPYEKVKPVIASWIANNKYPPTIADIRKKSLECTIQMQLGSGEFNLHDWLWSANPQWVDVEDPEIRKLALETMENDNAVD